MQLLNVSIMVQVSSKGKGCFWSEWVPGRTDIFTPETPFSLTTQAKM